MNIEFGGKLQSVLCLTAPRPEILGEFANRGDYSHAEGAELMILPDGAAAFVGTESLGEANVAVVTALPAAELVQRVSRSAQALGMPSQAFVQDLLSRCFLLSLQLRALASGGEMVRIGEDGGLCLALASGQGRAAVSA